MKEWSSSGAATGGPAYGEFGSLIYMRQPGGGSLSGSYIKSGLLFEPGTIAYNSFGPPSANTWNGANWMVTTAFVAGDGGPALIATAEAAPTVVVVSQEISVTEIATGFIGGITPGPVTFSTLGEMTGVLIGEFLTSWDDVKRTYHDLIH